jgi:catechol 2,3-dioxygenase-like lactoylglutathione lyase family enzyme
MIDHLSIGVRNGARAKRFYDAALAPLGYTCLSEGAGASYYAAFVVDPDGYRLEAYCGRAEA